MVGIGAGTFIPMVEQASVRIKTDMEKSVIRFMAASSYIFE
jgi:hypothetical protein